MKPIRFLLIFCLILNVSLCWSQKIAGTLSATLDVAEGYTLFAPLNTKTTYLIDNCGRVANSWTSNFFPGNTFYLSNNGSLVRTKRLANNVITGGGGGGGIEMFNWQGELIWSFEYNSNTVRQHHDIALLPSGNILMLAWVLKTKEEALAAGRRPDLIVDNVIWSEELLEIKPVLPSGGEIVWRWDLWDHIIQDYDGVKSNYGIVENHPELVNLNYTLSTGINDWIHANGIDYNPDLDQVLISSPFFNEFWIIDHSTTTAQAATHSGGKYNKGGDILYRWGNPQTYKRGSASDMKISGQHHVHWIDKGLPNEGKIMLFNNNAGTDFSEIQIVSTPQNSSGGYDLTGTRFGPENPEKIIRMDPRQKLFSRIMSGAEVQPNGNLLINSSLQGSFFELAETGEVVWEYRSPVTVSGIVGRTLTPENGIFSSDPTFRAIKYPPTFAGFSGKTMTVGEPIEGQPWFNCGLITAAVRSQTLHSRIVYPNPVKDVLVIENSMPMTPVVIRNVAGQLVERVQMKSESEQINVGHWPHGVYIIQVGNKRVKVIKE